MNKIDAPLVICPHCLATNRVPLARLGETPRCGKCRSPLFAGQPLDVDAAAFQRHIGAGSLPVLVDFWAAWCGPCKIMAPAFAAAAGMLEPQFRLLKVDTEREQALAARYGIRSIPTLMLFADGQEVDRLSGALDARGIVDWARRAR